MHARREGDGIVRTQQGICGCFAARTERCSRRLFGMKKRYLRIVRRMYRALRHPRLRHRDWWQALTHALFERRLWMPCRDTVATGLAIGAFFAVMPLPLQMLFAGVVAMRFRSNVPIAMAACWLSNPLTNLPIWGFQLWLGTWLCDLTGLPMPSMPWLRNAIDWLRQKDWFEVPIPEFIAHANLGSFLLGAVVSGFLFAAIAFPLVHLFALLMPHHLPSRRHHPVKVSAFMRKIRAQREARKQARSQQKPRLP
jgi:uncharacterized protein (DUF2062 family)